MARGKDEVQRQHPLGPKKKGLKRTQRALPTQQFTGTEKTEKEHKVTRHDLDQEGFLAPTDTSELNAGLEVTEYHDHDLLKAQAAKLKKETSLLRRELEKRATMCLELKDANTLLMDELKKICEPSVIKILEAQDPDNNPQTNQEMELSETDS